MAVGMVPAAERRAFIGAPPAPTDAAYDAIVEKLWDAAVAGVDGHAPDAPEAVSNLAALNLFAYLWSTRGGDSGGMEGDYIRAANALRKSGAMGLLRPYTVHRAGAI